MTPRFLTASRPAFERPAKTRGAASVPYPASDEDRREHLRESLKRTLITLAALVAAVALVTLAASL